jgi:hypothetical protein
MEDLNLELCKNASIDDLTSFAKKTIGKLKEYYEKEEDKDEAKKWDLVPDQGRSWVVYDKKSFEVLDVIDDPNNIEWKESGNSLAVGWLK